MLIKKTIRREIGLIENICEHGVGHPAFGSADFLYHCTEMFEENPFGIHGCDGCCSNKDWQIEDARNGCIQGNEIILELRERNRLLKNKLTELLLKNETPDNNKG